MIPGVVCRLLSHVVIILSLLTSPQLSYAGALAQSYERIMALAPLIDGARNQVIVQEAREGILRSRLRPQVNAQLSANQIRERDNLSAESFQGFRHSLSLSQSILDLESMATLEREKRLTDASRWALIATEHEIALQLTQRYFQVQEAFSRLKSLQSLVRTLKLRGEQGQAMFQAGQLSRLGLARLESRLSERQANLRAAEAQLQVAEAALFELDPKFELRELVIGLDLEIDWPELNSTENLVARSADDNPRIVELNQKTNAERLGLEAIERRRFPVIRFGVTFDERDINADNSSASETETISYGVSLNWPLYTGGGISAERDERLARLESVKIEQKLLKKRLSREIAEIVSSYRSGSKRVDAQAALLDAQMEAEKVLLAAFQQGAVSQSEYLDALDALASARIARDNAIYLTVFSWLRAQVISGGFSVSNLGWIDSFLATVAE